MIRKNHAAGPDIARTPRAGRRLAAVLAAVLLFALWGEAEHMADVEAHSGSVCEVCLFAAASGQAMAPTASLLLPAPGPIGRSVIHDAAQVPSFLLRRTHGPRAPPVLS